MPRIKFKNHDQKKFIKQVIERTASPSLRGLLQFGLETTYTNLKNYHTERRLLPKEIFIEMCYLANINPTTIEHEEISDQWGQKLGGAKGRRKPINNFSSS